MPTPIEEFDESLRTRAGDFRVQLSDEAAGRLRLYYELLLKWNPRLHLVAPCSPQEFATRHVLESLMLLSHLRSNARVVDIGSGSGLPIIPCLIARRDLQATLIERSQKKALFLREALRAVNGEQQARLVVKSFEQTRAPEVDFVTCRALERFAARLPALVNWSPSTSTLLLFTGERLWKQIEAMLPSAKAERIPDSDRRFLVIAPRVTPS